MPQIPKTLTTKTGRGSTTNTEHRFSSDRLEIDRDIFDHLEFEEKPLLHTQFFKDSSRTIVTENDSPDMTRGRKYREPLSHFSKKVRSRQIRLKSFAEFVSTARRPTRSF
jgi:hypothetical protein